jgi:DNA-damage-inducible protein D
VSDEIKEPPSSVFDGIKHINNYGMEYWSARDLQESLDYANWAKFENVIEKAMIACANSGYSPDDHFVRVGKMVQIGSDALREIKDYHLSRYACYLIVQNSDPTKEIVALWQTYFAVQTRRQEIMDSDLYNAIESEDDKRLYLREEMKKHNKQLAQAASKAGVILPKDYAIFQNHGY